MKTKLISMLAALFAVHMATAQYNSGFEAVDADGVVEKWGLKKTPVVNKGYMTGLDSVTKHSGRYVAFIKSDENSASYGACDYTLTIPAGYAGQKITLKGYIKTKAVTGYACFWMHVDAESNGIVLFDKVASQRVEGTADWQQYSITIDLARQGKQVVLGCMLTGSGTAWFDDIELSIDGNPLEKTALPAAKKTHPAADTVTFSKGSGFSLPEMTPGLADNLAALGRVWGFLKYYHPAVAAGNFNWDYELLRILPAYSKAADKAERCGVLQGWITQLGDVPTCKKCSDKTGANVFLKADNDWLKDNNTFTAELVLQLENIRANRHQGKSWYIDLAPGVGNPIFTNEKDYAAMLNPDDGYRMLSLFRYWNYIQYWFPYRHQVEGGNWQAVLSEFIPIFAAATDSLSYRLAALRLIARVGDTHAGISSRDKILSGWRGELAAPYSVKFAEGKAVITGSYNEALTTGGPIERGDVIEKINGKKTEDIVKQMLPLTTASNYATQLRNISRNLLRSKTNTLEVEVQRNGSTRKLNLTCYRSTDIKRVADWDESYFKDSSYTLLPGNIGYVTLGYIKNSQWPAIFEKFKDTKGLIIDIRNYPAEFVVFTATQYLLGTQVPFVKFTSGELDYPGMFTMGGTMKVGSKNSKAYKGKLVILINEITQSQAEYTTMALRTVPGSVVVGSTTAGADGNVSPITLPGGIATMISGIGVFYPDGKPTQRIGIVPDVEVKPAIRAIKEGRDELMEKAVEIINATAR